MAYPDYVKEHARRLRTEKHLSIDEIAERLALPKTTIYEWVKDLPLGREKRWSVGQRRGTEAMQAKFKHLRDNAYAQGLAEFDDLVKRPTFRDFVALYVAEGYKRSRNTVSLCNSDDRVVAMAAGWLRALGATSLFYELQYHADQDLDELRRHWGDVLEIDGSVIRLLPKSNSGELHRRVWRCRYGVLAVKVHDTLLRSRLQAWIDRVRAEWALDSAADPRGVAKSGIAHGLGP